MVRYCKGHTKSGDKCQRIVTGKDDYCYQHAGVTENTEQGIITFYNPKGKYGIFSNYYVMKDKLLKYKGRYYDSSEHAYQAAKFIYRGATSDSIEYGEIISTASTPNIARILAQQKIGGGYKWRTELNPIIERYLLLGVKPRDGWHHIKVDIMRDILIEKFSISKYRDALMKTKGHYLIEDSPRDDFWGIGKDGGGQNMLGKLLVEIRDGHSLYRTK